MTPVAERTIPAESAAAELDLPGDLGGRGLDDVAGIVADYYRALDYDRARRLQRDRDRGGLLGDLHEGNMAPAVAVRQPAPVPLFPSPYAVLNPNASSS